MCVKYIHTIYFNANIDVRVCAYFFINLHKKKHRKDKQENKEVHCLQAWSEAVEEVGMPAIREEVPLVYTIYV